MPPVMNNAVSPQKIMLFQSEDYQSITRLGGSGSLESRAESRHGPPIDNRNVNTRDNLNTLRAYLRIGGRKVGPSGGGEGEYKRKETGRAGVQKKRIRGADYRSGIRRAMKGNSDGVKE